MFIGRQYPDGRKCTTMVPFSLAKVFPKTRCISGLHPQSPKAKVDPPESTAPNRRPGAGAGTPGPRAAPGLERHAPARGPRRAQVHVAAGHLPALLRPAARPATRLQPLVGSGLLGGRLHRTTPSSRPTASPSWAARPVPPDPGTCGTPAPAGRARAAPRSDPRSPDTAGRRPPASAERTWVALGIRQLAAQLPIEAVQQRMHAGTPGSDLVELLLQLGREPHVSDLREMLPQPRADQPPQRRHDEHAAVEQHVTAIDQRLEGVRTGRRATDAGRLQLGHQRRLGVARRRLRPRRGDIRAALPGAQTVPAARSGTAGGSSASEAGGSTR